MTSTQKPVSFGNYEIIRELGSGGYADVFLARDNKLERRIALKILKQQWMAPEFVQSFEQEARSAATLNHPNIVTIYEQGEHSGRFYISMEFMAGGSLEDLLERAGPMPPDRLLEIVRQIASALDYAHDRRMIHRDIKPSNILIQRVPGGGERPILADFGIAKALQESSGAKSTRIVGTTPYMAPEQINRPKEIDRRVDIYALGVVAYQLLTGELPFGPSDKPFLELAQEISTAPPPSLTEQGVHPRIEREVFRALEKDPDDRFESAGSLAGALEAAVRRWKKETGERESKTTLAGLAAQAMDQGEWEEAATYYRRYLALSPDSQMAKSNLAVAEREIELARLRAEADEREAREDWDGVMAALRALLDIRPQDEAAGRRLADARMQKELQSLSEQAHDALQKGNLDRAIAHAQRLLGQAPDYPGARNLLNTATRKKVEGLKDRALLEAARRNAQAAQGLVGEIREIDPRGQFYDERVIDEIIASASRIEKEESEKRSKKRSRYIIGIAFAGLVLLIAVLGCVLLGPIKGLLASLPILASTPVPTDTVMPTSMPVPTTVSTATPTPSPSPTQAPTSSPSPTSELAARAGDDGAPLRPGATTWWSIRRTIPAGTPLELLGYDPAFPGWVYVGTVDGDVEGWTEIEGLEIYRDLESLPLVTPVPTLTSVPATPVPPASCQPGPLELEAWPVNKACTAGGWTATIYAGARGGDCAYTYYWDRVAQGEPTSGSMTFDIQSAGFGTAIVGQVSVTSAGETVVVPLHISPPSCGQ